MKEETATSWRHRRLQKELREPRLRVLRGEEPYVGGSGTAVGREVARVVTPVGRLKGAAGTLSAGHPGRLCLWTGALGKQCEEALF